MFKKFVYLNQDAGVYASVVDGMIRVIIECLYNNSTPNTLILWFPNISSVRYCFSKFRSRHNYNFWYSRFKDPIYTLECCQKNKSTFKYLIYGS